VFDPETQKGLVLESEVFVEGDRSISGYCTTSNWVKRTYYFTLTFDQPFAQQSTLEAKANERAPRYLLDFNLPEHKQLQVKISLSTVSVEGARRNMQEEVPHWNFDAVYADNLRAWEGYLNRVSLETSPKKKEIFYTSLYHLLLQPANIADVDGQYRGADNRVEKAIDNEYYSTLSIWDVYRAAFPLLQILAPEKVDGIVRSMLLHHKAAGFLPIWTVWGQDNYCMIGNHAIPMLLSAYQNDFRGFDARAALNAMVETSTLSHIHSDWELYNQYGYYPFDKVDLESVSKTLESGYDDWCVASMARLLDEPAISRAFETRSQYYKNLFDPSSGFFRGKNAAGSWRSPFDPLTATSPLNNPGDYTEANAWQYLWTPAQYDHLGLMDLLGGQLALRNKLDEFFGTTAVNPDKFLGQEAMIGQYAHGNEPSHHIAYLYAYTDEPKKGQY
jgi:predicted alpha-1,2-mannosidase